MNAYFDYQITYDEAMSATNAIIAELDHITYLEGLVSAGSAEQAHIDQLEASYQ
jgi:hypothetical protein